MWKSKLLVYAKYLEGSVRMLAGYRASVAYKHKCISAQFTSGKDSGFVWSSNTVNYFRE
jgi:hypothetical protein